MNPYYASAYPATFGGSAPYYGYPSTVPTTATTPYYAGAVPTMTTPAATTGSVAMPMMGMGMGMPYYGGMMATASTASTPYTGTLNHMECQMYGVPYGAKWNTGSAAAPAAEDEALGTQV